MKFFSEKSLHAFFNAGILIKAIDSIGEITLGIILYLDPQAINKVIAALFSDELTETPRDAVFHFFLHGWSGFSGGNQYLWGFLFLGHGLTKIFLVVGLLKNKLWAYPVAAFAFVCFATYQTYQIFYAPSVLLMVFTVLDIIFVALILHEYRYQQRNGILQKP